MKPATRLTRRLDRRQFLGAVGGVAILGGLAGRGLGAEGGPQVRQEAFGKLPDGSAVELFTLTSGRGMTAKVMTYGATLTTVETPDRNGKSAIITLHLDTLDDYVKGHPLFGSVVGRYANRIANAKFMIDGKEYPLVANARPHHIHGGNKEGFAQAVFKGKVLRETDWVGVELTRTSPDGEGGFPGALEVTVVYKLTADHRLIMEYTARTDKPTHVNLTNHAYWNLAGAGSRDVLDHTLLLNADQYLVAGPAKIPTGEIRDVKGTVMDFTQPMKIGSRIKEVEGENYDHCYVLKKAAAPAGGAGATAAADPRMALAARVVDPATGRVMEVSTTQPGVQLYTAKSLTQRYKGSGMAYGPYHALCLETQAFPDAPNQPKFPSTLLRPGETYRQVTVHRFGVE